ncbi:MAG: undecaprenyldiphospho-muramoylpentapeptide beta-N-acetylglucosaminyltransferase [candidate division FCPU426 bacterium]
MARGNTFGICGGGTGGHIFPALAVIQALRREDPDVSLCYFGRAGGREEELATRQQIPFCGLVLSGLERRLTLKNVKSLWQASQGWGQARRELRRLNVRVVLGTGGYVCGPVMMAAVSLGLPTIIHESNLIPGLANRWAGAWVTKVCVNYPQTAEYFPAERVTVTGFPLREGLNVPTRNEGCLAYGLDPNRPVLFVFPGSAGARRINQAMAELLPGLKQRKPELQLLWMTGEADLELAQGAMARSGMDGAAHPFITAVPEAYAAADLVLARAGAGTVAELSATGTPALLVPYPHATANHQLQNAEVMQKLGAAEVLLDQEVSPRRLLARLLKLTKRLSFMKECAAVLAADYPKHASQVLARLMIKLALKAR